RELKPGRPTGAWLQEFLRVHLSAVALANADSWLNIPIMPAASLCALLSQAIDYAGMFPPCGLALEPALQNQANYVRSPEAWMLNGFVLPVEQFDAAKQLLSDFDPQHPLRVAALGQKTASADAFLDAIEDADTAIRSFARYDVNLVSVSH